MHDNLNNQQKTVVITGGNRGIGLSMVSAYVKSGYNVIVGARSSSSELEKLSNKVEVVDFDARIEEDHLALAQKAIDLTGRLDAYINNAGYSEWRPIDKIDDDFLNDMIATNLKGVIWGCKAAANVMDGNGSIINISSLAGKRGSKNNTCYCATKFAVNGITQSLAKELGIKGIRVNAICPVLVKTDGLVEALKDRESPAAGSPDVFFQQFSEQQSAMKRLPEANEISSACLFLTSDQASAITGQCINVDCGVLPQ